MDRQTNSRYFFNNEADSFYWNKIIEHTKELVFYPPKKIFSPYLIIGENNNITKRKFSTP